LRKCIFTERQKELLRRWIETGEEDQPTKNLLSEIRQGFPKMAEDMELWMRTINVMQRRHVWRGYITRHSELGSALRRAGSALTQLRRGVGTSTA